MLIGAGIGLAFDALLAWYASDSCESADCHVIRPYLLVPPIVFALVGGMIGSAHRERG